MIFFDVTKSGGAAHQSGLNRVSARLREELGAAVAPVRWPSWNREARREDWFFTAELFSDAERPGFSSFLASRPCRIAGVFHDAIPLKHPHITWPQSVARHPGYMKLLAQFDRVWAVSRESRNELLGFWQWQGIDRQPPIEVLPLGADFNRSERAVSSPRSAASPSRPIILCLGIIEPRKNQSFLLNVAESLWSEGRAFELHLVGRINPRFGRPIVARIEAVRQRYRDHLHFHEAASDAVVARLFARARATALPTIAEGCGLPLLESLWQGVPCVCSDLPVLRENADAGGCMPVAVNDHAAWKSALRRVLTDEACHRQLALEAQTRPLPTWHGAAAQLLRPLA